MCLLLRNQVTLSGASALCRKAGLDWLALVNIVSHSVPHAALASSKFELFLLMNVRIKVDSKGICLCYSMSFCPWNTSLPIICFCPATRHFNGRSRIFSFPLFHCRRRANAFTAFPSVCSWASCELKWVLNGLHCEIGTVNGIPAWVRGRVGMVEYYGG